MRRVFALLLFVTFFACPAQSEQAPSFSARDVNGRSFSLSQFSGKPLVLYFWATWCSPCRKEVKKMGEIYKKFYPKGVEFLSVSLDTDPNELKQFIDEKKIEYPVLFEGKGWESSIASLFGIQSTPTFVILASNREIRTRGHGARELSARLKDFV